MRSVVGEGWRNPKTLWQIGSPQASRIALAMFLYPQWPIHSVKCSTEPSLQPAILDHGMRKKNACVSWRSWKGRTKNAATNRSSYPVSPQHQGIFFTRIAIPQAQLRIFAATRLAPSPCPSTLVEKMGKYAQPASRSIQLLQQVIPGMKSNDKWMIIHKLPGDLI